ncbi:MAG: dihydrodipicolinate synthase family protein, partial [Armatimonadota bacterium]
PVMTRVELTLPVIQRLMAHPNICGMKTSSGRKEEISWRTELPNDKTYLVGDESLLLRARQAGWQGTISGAANVLAPWLVRLCREQDPVIDELLQPLIQGIRSKPQPATHKAVLFAEGILSSPKPRLPLLEADGSEMKRMIDERLGAVVA